MGSEGVVILQGAVVLIRWQENVMMECFPNSVLCGRVLGFSSPSIEFLEPGC